MNSSVLFPVKYYALPTSSNLYLLFGAPAV